MREIYMILAKSHEDLANAYHKLAEGIDTETEITTDDTIRIETIRSLLAEKSHSGKSMEIKELLKKYNAQKLSSVDVEDYKALLSDAKKL